jgi:erythromycin esterase-like protein
MSCSSASEAPADAGGQDSATDSPETGSLREASASDAGTTEATPGLDAGLPPGIYPLAGDDAGLPTSDLAPLNTLLNGVQIIGLGESIHTSGGFYAMKNRVVRYLVENLGVRALAMETPRTLAETATAFIENGQGTLDDAISAVFPVFVSPDTEALFQWLSDYNRAHPGNPVYFYGFDEQQPDDDSAILQAFLPVAAPTDGPGLWAPIARNCSLTYNDFNDATFPGDFTACVGALDALSDYVTINEGTLIGATSQSDVARASMAIISLKSWQGEVNYQFTALGYEWRDQAMAKLFEAMHALRSPNAKTVIWAHNEHLSMHHWDVNTPGLGQWMTMGSYLAQDLGGSYQAIAQTGYHVGIDWVGVGSGYEATPTDPTSLELALHGLGQPYLLIDTHSPWIKAGQAYQFGTPSPETEIPAEQYRGFIFLDDSPPMVSPFWTPEPDGGFAYPQLPPTPSSFDGGLAAGSPCVVEPFYPGEVDLCARVGLACQAQALDPTSYAGTCALPAAGSPCQSSVGCAPGDVCLAAGPAAHTCAQQCSTTSDCARLSQVCALDVPSGQLVCQPNACSGPPLWACKVGDAGLTGTCVDTGMTGAGDAGTCFAAGAASLQGPCSMARSTDGGTSVCPASTVCLSSYAGSGCLPLCAPGAPDGGVGSCSGVCEPLWPSSEGVCLAPCTLSSDCPPSMHCASIFLHSGTYAQGCTYY